MAAPEEETEGSSSSCFVSRWLAGGASESKRPSFFGSLSPAAESAATSDKEKLVQNITSKLQQDEHATFTLTAREMRLLLDLPEPLASPPPVGELKPDSSIFDSWDFKASEDLSEQEVQAIMIALATESSNTNYSHQLPKNEGRDEQSTETIPLPPRLSSAARKISIQELPAPETGEEDSTSFLVALGSSAALPSNAPLDEDHSGRLSGIGSNPFEPGHNIEKPRMLALRQVSIQPFPTVTEDADNKNNNKKRPETLSSRQVSVQPRKGDSPGELHYVVTLPGNASAPPRPNQAAPQVSVQPIKRRQTECLSSFDETSAGDHFHPMSIRMNDKNFSFGLLVEKLE